jgi:hypothetical protein
MQESISTTIQTILSKANSKINLWY